MVRSPVEICLGTRPSQAAKSRPLENTSPVPIAATMALEMSGPMPGMLISRSHPESCLASSVISPDNSSMRSSSRRQSSAKPLMIRIMRGERTSGGVARIRQLRPQQPLPLANCDDAFQQESADLIHNAGALADEPLTHTMQGLQVELIDALRRHELHSGTLERLLRRLTMMSESLGLVIDPTSTTILAIVAACLTLAFVFL